MSIKNIYLLNPYADVIKVNAVGNSVFRLKLNGGVFYTKQEIINAVNSYEALSAEEDFVSRMTRWISSICANIRARQFAAIDEGNILAALNSYSDGVCGSISYYVYNLTCLFYDEHYCHIVYGANEGGGAHQWNAFTDGFFDQIRKIPNYKDAYVMASLEDIVADKFLYIEPLRNVVDSHNDQETYTDLIEGSSPVQRFQNFEIINNYDSLIMRLPSGSSITFPQKPSEAVYSELGVELKNLASLSFSAATGITGLVEMPCNVFKITGVGAIKIGETTYTLPDDEATVITLLQQTQNPGGTLASSGQWFNQFEILTNTGGIEAEFLVNHKLWMLYHNNVITYTIYGGSLTFERAVTERPIDTAILSVNKGLAGGWTLNNVDVFTGNKSFRLPISGEYWDEKLINYTANAGGKKPIRQYLYCTTKDTVYTFTAGDCVTEQCFAALLYPREETFADTLELTFTAVDGSSTYYTVDGSTPDATKTLYSAPFTISATTTVKWINIREGYANSHVNTRVITKTA